MARSGHGLALARRPDRQGRDRGRQRVALRRGGTEQELPGIVQEKATTASAERTAVRCRRRAFSNRPSSAEWSIAAFSQNQVGKKQTMQNALIQGKIPISIVSQMPKWRLMTASAAPVRTGPVKNGQNSRINPVASSANVPKVSTCSKVGKPSRKWPMGVASWSRLSA